MRARLFGNRPILTINQFQRLSNIFDNAGQVALGAFVFTQLINGFDSINVLVVISGIGTVVLCWTMSIWLARKGDFYEI